jgi:hypothetical protein
MHPYLRTLTKSILGTSTFASSSGLYKTAKYGEI